jgi:hypothetical protein
MIQEKTVSNMWYCDITPNYYGGNLLIGNENSHVIQINERDTYPLPYPGNHLLFFRMHEWFVDNRLFFAGKGHIDVGGNAWLNVNGTYIDLGPTHGNSPLCFYKEFLYIVRGPSTYDIYSLQYGNYLERGVSLDIGSQGIRFISNGIIYTGDATYGGQVAEYTLLDSHYTIGQGYNGGAILIDGNIKRVVEPGNTTFIRAYLDAGFFRAAIVKPGYAKFKRWELSDIPSFPNEVEPIPEPKPIPVPVPPKPIPEDYTPMRLPDFAQSIVNKLYLKFNSLALGDDAARTDLCRKIVETITFNDPSGRWGHKRQKGGSFSKDTLGKIESGLQIGFDLFNGSTRRPNDHPDSFRLDDATQEVSFFAGVNWLEDAIPAPGPSPAPDSDLLTRFKALEAKVARLEDMALVDGSRVALRTDNSNYVCAEGGGGGEINATRTQAGAWETLTVVKK